MRVDSLSRVSGAGAVPKAAPEICKPEMFAPAATPASASSAAPASHLDSSTILTLLEQLGQLKEKGILTDEEFATKKVELLKQL